MATNTFTRAETIVDAYNAVDPNEALRADDPRYFDFTEWRSLRSIVSQLTDQIARANQGQKHQKVLFTGHKGSGKSTELSKLAASLRDKGFFVVEMDADGTLDLSNVSYTDILLRTIHEIVGAIHETPFERAINPNAIEGLQKRLARVEHEDVAEREASLDVETSAGAGASIPGILSIVSKLTAKLRGSELQKRTLLRRVEADVALFIEDLNLLIDDLQIRLRSGGYEGLVVLVDSLDRVLQRSLDDEGRRTTHRELFVERADHLRAPNCAMVYTIPVSLLTSVNVANVWGTRPQRLPMVKIRERDGSDCDAALGAMERAVNRRLKVDALFENPEDVRDLCRASGGHLRDLMILLRQVISYTRDDEKITRAAVDEAIQELVNDYQYQIREDEIVPLLEVHETKRLPNRKDCADLPLKMLVLEYRNGAQWHDVHPAVLRSRLFQEAWAKHEATRDADD